MQDVPLPPYNVVKTHTLCPYISTRITPANWALSEGVKSHSLTTLRAHCPCRSTSINTAIMTNATPASCPTIRTVVHCRPLASPVATRTPTSALVPKLTQRFTFLPIWFAVARLLRKLRVCDKSHVKRRFGRKRVIVEMVKIIPNARKTYFF